MIQYIKEHKLKIVLIALLVIAIFGLGYYFFFSGNGNDSDAAVKSKSYDATADIEKALGNLKDSEQAAGVIKGVNTFEKVAVLTFDGMLDQDTAGKLLKLLKEYNVEAVFFLPGIPTSEDSEAVKLIAKSGQTIGNYTLSARKYMEDLAPEEMVEDFCKANRILIDITGVTPVLVKANLTEYTGDFLHAAYASSLSQAVKTDYFLNYQSFSSQKDADEFLKGIKRGSVISFKTDSPLNESEYIPIGTEKEAKPAIDKEASLPEKEEAKLNKNRALLQNVRYLLEAMMQDNYSLVPAYELAVYEDAAYSKDFSQLKAINNERLAQVHQKISTSLSSVALSFRGIGNSENLEAMLSWLKEKNIKATFFVTGNEILQYPERIKAILKAGHQIGNGGLTGESLEGRTFEEAAFEIYKCNELQQEKFQVYTKLFMPAYGQYSDSIREAAYALGYTLVTYSKNPVTDDKASIPEILQYFDKGFKQGDILYFRLDYHKDIVKIVDEIYKIIKNAGKSVTLIQNLLDNPADTDPYHVDKAPGNYTEMRKANNGHKARQLTYLYTAQSAVSFTFRSISDRDKLLKVLDALDQLDAKGTFFVTGKEILNHKENVDEIVRRGHQIANGGYGMNTSDSSTLDFETLCYEIDMGERYLKAYLGSAYKDSENKYYMPMYGAGGNIPEAASALGYDPVATYNRNAMMSAYRNLPADEIIAKYYANVSAMHRGDVVYFRLDYLTTEGAVEELVYETGIKMVKKVPYDIVTIADLARSNLVYEPRSRDDAIGSDLIRASYGNSETDLLSKIFRGYIGNPSISSSGNLLGFTDEEISRIDTTGRIDTKGEKVIFLTFDDWGYDDNITPLLDVLKKYDVKATFFVRVGNASLPLDSNMYMPNLLRAIALGGHDIGSHTFSHMKVDITTQAEKEQLQQNLVAAHREMSRYIGDTGSLKLFFRPPTLAVSKLGLETVFDCGYEYIINGDFSTHDYEASSAQELIDKFKYGIDRNDAVATQDTPEESVFRIEPGSIVVMHMSENAKFTPAALDEVIPYYMEQGYRFAKLSDYLTGGYENPPVVKTETSAQIEH
ncbi:polysaccharide deacetylase family protein [Desulfotomaculum sp. 1211_IL3151]|uniref:polysaccharide deacetylase family protein n=1 Tax=Desulfotomaculum sp. 1211_IL3151 TaxID=3084055 RepID=UPI002FDA7547